MRKTNIRINNYFVIFDSQEDGEKYYISDINDIKKWKDIDDLSDHNNGDVSDKLTELMEEYNISSNVNFCGFSDLKSGGGS